jgi:hypothetical protein
MTQQPSITCPTCGLTSYNANDIREQYCGHCHQWHRDMVTVRVATDEEQRAALVAALLADWAVDTCRVCGAFLGMGHRAFHVGICEECDAAPKS